jgi:hypothetical protein
LDANRVGSKRGASRSVEFAARGFRAGRTDHRRFGATDRIACCGRAARIQLDRLATHHCVVPPERLWTRFACSRPSHDPLRPGNVFASFNGQLPRQGRHSRTPYHSRSIRGPIVTDRTRPKESLFKAATPGCRPIQKANRSRNFGSDLEETSRAANDPGGDRPQPGNLDT